MRRHRAHGHRLSGVRRVLRQFWVTVDNTPFANSAPYFRDALALDNAPPRRRDRDPLRLFARALLDESITLPDLRAG